MDTIKVAIADDHPMIIGGLKNMLGAYPHILFAGGYPDGNALIKGLKETVPDVLLLDIQLPGKSGDELLPEILSKYPDLRVLVVTNIGSLLYIHNMIRLGAAGYVLKSANPENLIRAIETVYKGDQYLEPSLKEKLDQYTFTMKKAVAIKPSLTAKEKEVLRLTVDGLTIQEIAKQLFLGQRTVEVYRSNLFMKLEVKNMAALIKKVLEYGLYE